MQIILSRGRQSKYSKKQVNGRIQTNTSWTELIPYLDFINFAHPDTETANVGSMEYDEKKKGFFVKATREIRQGEQILINNPLRANYGSLLQMGVTHADWKGDTVSFRIRALPNDPEIKEKKMEFLGWGENAKLEMSASIGFELSD